MDPYKKELWKLEAMVLSLQARITAYNDQVTIINNQGFTLDTLTKELEDQLHHYAGKIQDQWRRIEEQYITVKFFHILN